MNRQTAARVRELPLPAFFDQERVGQVWPVPYQERAAEARAWARQHGIRPAAEDAVRICLMLVDIQNTFCIPEFELFVASRSGRGAVNDNIRLCEFIYRSLGTITEICPTMDTHGAMQIFHPVFWINDAGDHPQPFTQVSVEDVRSGRWKVNPAVAHAVASVDCTYLERHALHYVERLAERGKYQLTIWPYHAMLGGIGHALVSAVEEAVFFHNIARYSQTGFETKGSNPLTEHYSVLRPEVLDGPDGRPIAEKNARFLQKLLAFNVVLIAGQAKSHCVAWTIDDLLDEISGVDRELAKKVYLLEDCTSPVVIPGVVDYTEQAEAAFRRFAAAQMHIVRSTEPIVQWPDISLAER
jgi:nicotinamidase-related amidase